MTQQKTTTAEVEMDDTRNAQAGDNRMYVVRVVILAAMLALLVALFARSAEAIPVGGCNPIPDCLYPIDRSYKPFPEGFNWQMPQRYPGLNSDGVTDFSQNSPWHEPDFVQATSGFQVNFNGCASQFDSLRAVYADTYFTYSWSFPGSEGSPTTFDARRCKQSRTYMQEGSYVVKLTIKDAGATLGTFEQTVTVKDKLIVAIGDSYGAGEGNPDRPQTYEFGLTHYNVLSGKPEYGLVVKDRPKWADKRCHRSATAGSAQAARELEYADPHSSVTFVFLACSGASISWDKPDESGKRHGSGILGRYEGREYEGGEWLPPQLEEVQRLVGNRQIDALVMSAGGNDAGFADVLQICLDPRDPARWHCDEQGASFISERVEKYLPAQYQALNDKMNELRLNVAKNNVYLTEYPIGTRGNAHDGYCGSSPPMSFISDPLLSGMTVAEAKFVTENVAWPLKEKMKDVAEAYGWTYVGGIDEEFSNFLGEISHGYCSDDPWVRTMLESNDVQGPQRYIGEARTNTALWAPPSGTTGTMHPNAMGQDVYKRAILNAIGAPSPGPTFAASEPEYAPGRVVVRVTATDPLGIVSESVSVNATGACQVEGITCTTRRPDGQRLEWTLEVTKEGLHTFDFRATDGDGQASSFIHEVEYVAPAPPIIDGPTDGSSDTDGSVTFFGAAEAGSTISLFEEGKQEPVGSATADASDGWSITLSGVGKGLHTYTAKATNSSGLTSVASAPVRVTVVAPPTNDAFASAQQIGGSDASVSGTTAGATREEGEPDHYTSNPVDAGMWQGDHTVWYSWTPLASGPATIDTCQANIDSILAVYTGSALNSLSRVADNNNDFCGGGWGSKVTFNAQAGTTYHIVVGDAGGGRESTFTLKVSPPPPPPDSPPKVTSTTPPANATGIAPGVNVSAIFSEAMMGSSINATTCKLMKAGTTTAIGAVVSYDPTTKKVTLNPNANLSLGTKYKAVVSTGAKDLAGNPLDQDSATTGSQPKQWVFTVRR